MKKRNILALALVTALVIALGLGTFFHRSRETGAWGLSFRQEGAPPVANASRKALQPYDAVYLGNPEEKVLYLTFDAGYENGNTETILDAMAKHNAKGTFFLVGNFLEKNPELVSRMVREGHTVGNHTMHHPDMSKIQDPEAFKQELKGVEDLFRQITGKELPRYYRPPQGVFSQENLKQAKALGYKTVFWSLAYVDWNRDSQPTPDQAFSKLLPRTHNGAVVLLHLTSATNARIMDELLTRWEDQGYRFGTVEELFNQKVT